MGCGIPLIIGGIIALAYALGGLVAAAVACLALGVILTVLAGAGR